MIAKYGHFLGAFLWISGIFAAIKAAKLYQADQIAGRLDAGRIPKELRPVFVFAIRMGIGLTWLGGIAMLVEQPAWLSGSWLHVKLLGVAWILALSVILERRAKQWTAGEIITLPAWLRSTGKILIIVLALAVFKPF